MRSQRCSRNSANRQARAAQSARSEGEASANDHNADNDFVRLRTLTSLAVVDAAWFLDGPRFPYAMAWLENRQIALLASGNKKAFVYGTAAGDATLKPTGATFVLADVNAGPFAHGFSQPPQYNVGADLLPLVPLSLNSLARAGSARATTPIDSGAARTPWHRVYLEASLPARCGVVVWLAAADDPAMLGDPSTTWFPHLFGGADGLDAFPDAPRGVWQRVPSEVPFHRGLLGATERDRKGLFMALVQRANQLMYELTTLYPSISGLQQQWGWDFLHYGSPDGLPVVGPHRNFPRHLFALGHGRHGAGMAWLAARILLREFQGEPAKGD